MATIRHWDTADGDGGGRALRTISKHIDYVFNRAPVMMHSVDREGRLAKVNRRWLRTLGYRRDEVLGRCRVSAQLDTIEA